ELAAVDADILVNATPVGMFPKVRESPVPKELLRGGLVVFDAVYNPIETQLLRQAKEAGCVTVSGVEMFVEQGAQQFELWTGEKAPREIMKQVVLEALSK
ncbi:MAG: shikimate dehydrogenase, partial [Candidatus Diapherotrites archaeon]|nr:shikimate dehydrogenase [Candidatus Diapherotrites archaeon]